MTKNAHIMTKQNTTNHTVTKEYTLETSIKSARNLKWKMINAIRYVLPYPRKVLNYTGLLYDLKRGNAATRYYPVKLGMEVTGRCNLSCPLCPRTADNKRDEGDMKWDDYRKVIDSLGPYLFHVRLHSLGEPMMHPQLSEMVAYAHKKGIYTNFHTNGHFLTERSVLRLFEAGLDEINVAIDGMSQETYSHYRVGGNLKKVQDGITTLCSKKQKLKRKRPRVNLQFLVMAHNEHEISAIKAFAQKTGVDRLYLKSVNITTGKDAGKRTYLPADKHYLRYNADENSIQLKKSKRCTRTFVETIVNWDGSISICTGDHSTEKRVNGNAFKQDIKMILFGEEYVAARRKSMRMEYDTCAQCMDADCVV